MRISIAFFFFLLTIINHSTAQLDIQLETYVSGLASPIGIENAGDERLFILERSGNIRIIDGDGNVLDAPFLNINSKVHNTGGQSEQGLLGLAFHPDYANNGYFFVHYTANDDDGIVARYSVDANNPNLADPDSEEIILEVNQPYGNHNGGHIAFGPDGYLYIGLGDGGSANDPQNLAQNRQNFLGKMLRIDIDNGLPYTIPSDNPFVEEDATLDEIWAIGLRNPWRFNFDRATGDLWIADVGQGQWEEINYQAASSTGGENYGWRCYEGAHTFNTSGCNDASEYTEPVDEYNHQGFTHCSITGGYMYRGAAYPDMQGHYFYTDYCSGRMRTTSLDDTGNWVMTEAGNLQTNITAFGEDSDGEMYAARLNGQIYKVTSALCANFEIEIQIMNVSCVGDSDGSIMVVGSGGAAPYSIVGNGGNLSAGEYLVAVTDANGCVIEETVLIEGVTPLDVSIEANENMLTSETNATISISYQWYKDGVAIDGADEPNYEATVSGEYYLEVVDENGCLVQSSALTVMISSIENLGNVEQISFTPNPFDDYIDLNIRTNALVNMKVSLLDTAGKIVFAKDYTVKTSFSTKIMLENLPTGIYFLNFQTKAGHATAKVVKQ